MADAPAAAPDTPSPTAGRLLRQAREAQGMHIAVLAASLKVPQRKLEALEQDRLQDLPDATFARALAQSVCRVLKVDAGPVMALLPRTGAEALDQVSAGLNTPFRERAGMGETLGSGVLRHPATAIVAVLLLAALAVWFWPRTVPQAEPPPRASEPAAALPLPSPPAASEPEALAASAAATAGSAPMVETVHSAPPMAATEAAASVPADAMASSAPALLSLRASEESWVEVADATGRTLLSRTVQPGERIGLDGALPLRVVVGNVSATELQFRGQPVNLAPQARDNVARIDLK